MEGHYAKYSDSACTQLSSGPTSFSLGCATSIDDTTSNVLGSGSITCSVGSTLPIDTAQNFMTERYSIYMLWSQILTMFRNYNVAGCDTSEFSSFSSYLKDTCVNNNGVPTKAILTSFNTYSSMSSCTSNAAAATSTSITVNSCVQSTNDDDSSDAFTTKWTFDAATTTYAPTIAPTSARK